MKRLAWLSLGLLIVAAFILIQNPGGDPGTGAPLPESPPGNDPSRARSPDRGRPAPDRSAGSQPTVDELSDLSAAPLVYHGQGLSGEALPPGFVAVRGSLKVRDGEGGLVGDLSGSLTIGVETRDSEGNTKRRWQKIKVDRGSWSAWLPQGANLGGKSAVLDGRAIRVVVAGQAVEDGLLIELIGWFEDVRLRVVDSVTGDDLADLTVVRSPAPWTEFGRGCFLRPPAGVESESLCEGESSPLRFKAREISKSSGASSYFVRAEGYGWRCFRFASPTKREQLIQLQREATLSITVLNLPRAHAAVLRLRPIRDKVDESIFRSALLWEQPLDPATPTVVLEALQPQSFSVAVEIGRSGHDSLVVLAEQEVQLFPDRETSVLLTCERPPDAPQAVPLAGSLTIPPAWATVESGMAFMESVSIRFEMKHRPADFAGTTREILRKDLVETGTPGLFRWDAGDVLPGRFVAVVRYGDGRADNWSTEFVVGPAGTRQLDLELPPPAELIIHLKSAGGPSPDDRFGSSVSWRAGTGQPAPSASGMRYGPGPHHLRLPVGPLLVSARWHIDDGAFQAVGERLQLRPGRNEVTLELNRRVGVRMILAEGDEVLPGRSLWSRNAGFSHDAGTHMSAGYLPSSFRIKAVDGPGGLVGWSGYPQVTFYLSAPGLYEISLDGLQGYRPVAPRVVNLQSGPVTELRIELERQ